MLGFIKVVLSLVSIFFLVFTDCQQAQNRAFGTFDGNYNWDIQAPNVRGNLPYAQTICNDIQHQPCVYVAQLRSNVPNFDLDSTYVGESVDCNKRCVFEFEHGFGRLTNLGDYYYNYEAKYVARKDVAETCQNLLLGVFCCELNGKDHGGVQDGGCNGNVGESNMGDALDTLNTLDSDGELLPSLRLLMNTPLF